MEGPNCLTYLNSEWEDMGSNDKIGRFFTFWVTFKTLRRIILKWWGEVSLYAKSPILLVYFRQN